MTQRPPSVPWPLRIRGRVMACLAPVLLLLVPTALAANPDGELRALVRGAIDFYNEREPSPLFSPTPEQMQQLLDGEVVKIRRKVPVREVESREEEHHERLTAYYLVHQPMLRVWLSALTPEFNAGDRLTEVRLRADAHGNSRWYQHVTLPWPVADRHWTIDLHKNPELCRVSGGRIWQHAWQLTENGEEIARETVASGRAGKLTPESIANAIYLPVNRGSWAMFALRDDLTLIAYELSTSLGGKIPESLVNTLAMSELDRLLREVGRISEHIDQLYVKGHSPIYSGEGYRIPWFGEDPPSIELKSRAVLPADSSRAGPSSGHFIEAANGVELPFTSQPVQGFSDLEPHPAGGFWAISDNGYGTRANSADYVLVIHHLRPDFQNGEVERVRSVELRDPRGLAGFPLVAEAENYPGSEILVDPRIREERLLTGHDFDPEGLAAMSDGSFWVGDEFGPFLLHFDAEGRLLEAPVQTPGVWAEENPLRPGPANHPSSGGFEGLCPSKDGRIVYGLLEKAAAGDSPDQLRLYRFDPARGRFLEEQPYRRYPLDARSGHFIGAICALNERELAVLERDDLQGKAAAFKRVFVVDLEDHEDGLLRKREWVDLLRIPDPVSLAVDVEGAREEGTFALPFITLEGMVSLDPHTLVICNDNNYPFSVGRHLRTGAPDDNEIVLIHLRN